MSIKKCKFCSFTTADILAMGTHLENEHPDMMPPDMSGSQFYYFMKTGRSHGSCVMCKKDTRWNEKTHKYHRFCDNPKCREEYIQLFRNRMIGKHGKITLLNDPEQQKLMLSHRKISGVYRWVGDPRFTFTYTGSYEFEFCKFMNLIMDWDPTDLMMPSPNTFYYIYEGKKHFYIPDAYIPSLNLQIEIKDGGDNPNKMQKIQDVDKVKEKLKDDVMISNKSSFNYLKITNKEHKKFFKYLEKAKQQYADGNNSPIIMI